MEVDWVVNSITSKIVLKGEYSNSELDYLQTLPLTHCKSEQAKTSVGESIDLSEWKDKIHVWKERTTTTPSEKHLGHYKTFLVRGPFDPKSEEGQAFWPQQNSLALINVDLINYTLKHRYSYKQWKTIMNIILQKDKGIIWQNLIKYAKEQGTLNSSQVGGRAGCNANTLTLMEELKTDISRCSRKSLIKFDNDVASCYDWVIPNLANLIGRKK
eukprot:10333261-Ditylum_brightwellii.AAC.1